MDEAFRYLQDSEPREGNSAQAFACTASEDRRRATPILERQISEALDTGQLAFYLCFRGIPKWAITDIGVHAYFQQYDNPDADARRAIIVQLERAAAETDMAGTLDMFRHFLEGDHREQFYDDIYRLVAQHVRSMPRPIPLADLLHPMPADSDSEVESSASTVMEIHRCPRSLAGGRSNLDIINVYQHAWDNRADAAELRRMRARILEKVDACIQQVPWRNLCVCAGDWNVQLVPAHGMVGNSTAHAAGQRQSAPEKEALTDLMIARHLVALNTWFRALRREANRASRQARKQRFEHLLQEAEKQASQNNTHKLYAIIRQLAPKQPYRRVKIYGVAGEILSREAEADRLREHFQSIFQGSAEPWTHACDEHVEPPTLEAVQWALEQTPLRKAVPPHFAPGAAWRAAATILAPYVHKTVQTIWSGASVPQHWKAAECLDIHQMSVLGLVNTQLRPVLDNLRSRLALAIGTPDTVMQSPALQEQAGVACPECGIYFDCETLPLPAEHMTELTKEGVASLFGAVLPAVSMNGALAGQLGAQATQLQDRRPPATPQSGRAQGSQDASKKPERPAKFQRQHAGMDNGKGKGKHQKAKRLRETSGVSSAPDPEGSLIPLLAQLCLRHEDSIKILQVDRAYTMIFKTKGEETMLVTINALSVKWKELQAAGQTECSKRMALFKGVLLELQTRAKALLEVEAKVQLLVQYNWLTRPEGREPAWMPLVWSVAQQKEIPCPEVGPLSHSDAMKAIETLLELASEQIVQRFHPTRQLAEEYTGEVLEFKLETSLKGDAAMKVHEALEQLCSSAIWMLVGDVPGQDNQGVPLRVLENAFETDDGRIPRKLEQTEHHLILTNMLGFLNCLTNVFTGGMQLSAAVPGLTQHCSFSVKAIEFWRACAYSEHLHFWHYIMDHSQTGRERGTAGAAGEPTPAQSLDIAYLVYIVQLVQFPLWALVDSGISCYFRQHEHCAATRTEVFDQIQSEVQGRDARHVLVVFCMLLDGECRTAYLEEVYSLLLPAIDAEIAQLEARMQPDRLAQLEVYQRSAETSGPFEVIIVSDSDEAAPGASVADAASEAEKRAYKRAMVRAQTQGVEMRQGRLLHRQGRVLHTRIPAPGGASCLDVVNVYQHAWDQRADAAELRRKRARILDRVDSCLQQVPWRNVCVCAGDWNVQLAPSPGMVGNSTVHVAGHRQSAPDMEALTDVMIARHLVALNTWSGPRRQAFTFEHQEHRTQLDYIFARRHQVTNRMRQCKPLQAFPVTAWRQSGLHRPLAVVLDYRWQPKARTHASRRVDTDALAQAVQWHTPQLHAFQDAVRQQLQTQVITSTLDLHQVLYESGVQFFPAVEALAIGQVVPATGGYPPFQCMAGTQAALEHLLIEAERVKIYGTDGEILSSQDQWEHAFHECTATPSVADIGAAWRATAGILAPYVHKTVRAVHLVQEYAYRCPQHAYLPQRSTEGGYILSLDMSMAFDAVPRSLVRDSLLAAGVGDHEVHIIMEWLTGSTYHLQHAHINLRIVTERGIRQGCILSPLIWTCFTCYVAYQLEPIIPLTDLQIYADDFLLSKIFHTKQQFLDALQTAVDNLRQRLGLAAATPDLIMQNPEMLAQATWAREQLNDAVTGLPFLAELMTELTKEGVTSLFAAVLPAVSLLEGGTGAQGSQNKNPRPPATPLTGQAQMQGPKDNKKPERPAKFQKGQGKGKNKSKRQRETSEASSERAPEQSLIPLIAKLCLRHEDSINILQADRAYTMIFKTTGGETMLSTVNDLSMRWKELQAAGKTDCPKRMALFKGILLELLTRAKAVLSVEEKVQLLMQYNWIVKQDGREPAWMPLVWSVAQQKEIVCPDVGPLPHSDAVKALETLLALASGQIVQRFHPTRQLAEEYTGEVLEFKLETSIKGLEAMKVHEALETLCSSAIWMLVGARLRPQGLKRDPLARKLQELLSGGVFAWSAVLQQWSRPQQQHDIGEFAMHALPKLRTGMMQGLWFARVRAGTPAVPEGREVDRGPLHLPITMPIPEDACTIQQCVEAWCQQDDAHALGFASPLILVQLGRFRQRSHRHVSKFEGIVELDGIISIPVFANDNNLDLNHCQYRVIAGAFHIGNTPASGHYRGLLCEACDVPGPVNPGVPLRALENAFETDDGRIPRKLDSAEHSLISSKTRILSGCSNNVEHTP
ncbi:unnamed protein product [Symbiodinium sp. CCMP2592]|nr:unnamed protein product [Symbiodinium sp. CCMP2592]